MSVTKTLRHIENLSRMSKSFIESFFFTNAQTLTEGDDLNVCWLSARAAYRNDGVIHCIMTDNMYVHYMYSK